MKVLIDGGGQGHFYEQHICKETPTPALEIGKGNTSLKCGQHPEQAWSNYIVYQTPTKTNGNFISTQIFTSTLGKRCNP